MVVIIIETSSHLAFATTEQITITQGSGAGQSCVATANCYYPNSIQITVGDTVTWTNQDSVGHTVTSGQPTDTQTGTIFDSSLITAGGSYSVTFTQAGTYNYFDLMFPWMTGEVIVVGSQSQAPTIPSTTSSIPSTATSIQYNIPYWIKNDAKWWSEGQISDDEFVKAIQYLIDNGILTPNQAMSEINQLQSQNQAIRQSAIQTTNEINQLQQENQDLKQQLQNLQNINQQSQNPIQDNGKFNVVFPDSSNPIFQKIGQDLEQSGQGTALENSLNHVFNLPYDLTISFADCGQENSWYDPDSKKITMCYDLLVYYISFYNTLYPNNSTQATTYAIDAILFTFFHELGHALIDVYHLPATGKEEDAVDQLSTMILLGITQDNTDNIKPVAIFFLIQGLQQNYTTLPFWDEHSFNLAA